MAIAVTTVVSGGLPVTDVTATHTKLGLHVAERANGLAITKGPGGLPVNFAPVQDWPSGGGGGGTAPPDVLTGLIGWWDASVTASLTLTGSNIDAIADQSGANNHAVWIGFGKPVYSATGFNSRPAIMLSATGVGNALQVSPFPMGTGSTLTAWYVGNLNQPIANPDCRALGYAPPSGNDFAGVSSWSIANKSSDPLNLMQVSRNNVGTPFTCTAGANHRVIVTINSSGVQTAYVDGVSTTLVTAAGNWVSGGTLCLGRASPSGNNYWGGSLGELGVATGFSSPAVAAQLDTYLKSRWGL